METMTGEGDASELVQQARDMSLNATTRPTNDAPPHDEATTSPYYTLFSSSPIKWRIWSSSALSRATSSDSLIFLSIGVTGSEWCAAMAHEAFASRRLAATLESFVPILLDRQLRPDVEAIYMAYMQASKRSGGWPLNVVLTPQLHPIYGCTYVSDSDVHGLCENLESLAKRWKESRAECVEQAAEIVRELKTFAEEGVHGEVGGKGDEGLDLELLEGAIEPIQSAYDDVYGGFGFPPKFPQVSRLRFLLELGSWKPHIRDILGEETVTLSRNMVLSTLRSMARGAIHDHLGGGFFRCAQVRDWTTPVFEKQTVDQVQLLQVYIDASLATGEEGFGLVVDELAELLCGLYESSKSMKLESDENTPQGLYYVFRSKDFDTLLTPEESSVAKSFYGVLEEGNIPRSFDPFDEYLNQNVLYQAREISEIATEAGLDDSAVLTLLTSAKQKLRENQLQTRPPPPFENVYVTSLAGLSIAALVRASSARKENGARWLASAIKLASKIETEHWDVKTSTLRRFATDGQALAEDYAGLVSGLITLYSATENLHWLHWADSLMQTQISIFAAPSGGFIQSPPSSSDVILPLKPAMDASEPSLNALSIRNLLYLAALLQDTSYRHRARDALRAYLPEMTEHPALFTGMLSNLALYRESVRGIHIVRGSKLDEKEEITVLKAKTLAVQNSRDVALIVQAGEGEDVKWLKGRNRIVRSLLDDVQIGGAKSDAPMKMVVLVRGGVSQREQFI